MNWAEVGRTVAGFAPLLGKLLPIPGAILGVSAWHRGRSQVEAVKKGMM